MIYVLNMIILRTSFFLLLFLMPSLVRADFKLPSNIYLITELEDAQKKASEDGKPIAFLYTNKDSTCGLCQRAGELILKELKSRTVMVYLEKPKECPANVWQALSREGKYIPKVAVFNAGLTEEIGVVIYENIKREEKKAFKEIKKAIRDYGRA